MINNSRQLYTAPHNPSVERAAGAAAHLKGR